MNKPAQVKELFEDNFIEKFLTLLYSEELAIEKYKIDINKIMKEAEIYRYRLAGEYASSEISFCGNPKENETREKKYFDDLETEKKLYDKYHFIYRSDEKYTFESFLKQIYLGRNIKAFFFEEDEFPLEHFFINDSNILLNELMDAEKINICSTELPFTLDTDKKEKLSFKYDNRESTFFRAYKIIIEEVFNYTIEELYKDIHYQSFIKWQDPELIDILKIEAIFETIKQRFINFRQSFFEHFETFIQFAFAESLIFSSKSKLYYNKFKELDNDKRKPDFYENVINKLLTEKKDIYKKLSNLPEDRRGGTKIVKDADFIEDKDIMGALLLEYKELQGQLAKIKTQYKINKYGNKIKKDKFDNIRKFKQMEPEIFGKLSMAYEYLKEKDDTKATNHRNKEEFIIQTTPEFLAYAILVYENRLNSTLETLKTKLSKKKVKGF